MVKLYVWEKLQSRPMFWPLHTLVAAKNSQNVKLTRGHRIQNLLNLSVKFGGLLSLCEHHLTCQQLVRQRRDSSQDQLWKNKYSLNQRQIVNGLKYADIVRFFCQGQHQLTDYHTISLGKCYANTADLEEQSQINNPGQKSWDTSHFCQHIKYTSLIWGAWKIEQ